MLKDFIIYIMETGDTTNEQYYALQNYYEAQNNVSEDLPLGEILKKANQLMWLNLSLSRSELDIANKKRVLSQKDSIIKWFEEILPKLQ